MPNYLPKFPEAAQPPVAARCAKGTWRASPESSFYIVDLDERSARRLVPADDSPRRRTKRSSLCRDSRSVPLSCLLNLAPGEHVILVSRVGPGGGPTFRVPTAVIEVVPEDPEASAPLRQRTGLDGHTLVVSSSSLSTSSGAKRNRHDH